MVDWSTPLTAEEMYGHWPLSDDAIDAALDQSRRPRPADTLYDRPVQAGIGPTSHLLDIGGRDAAHGVVLAERIGCRVTSLDPSSANLAEARTTIAEAGAGVDVGIGAARIEALPLRGGSIDGIWCRDVLSHVDDLATALAECRRVVIDDGPMIVYQTFATPWLEPAEQDRLVAGLALVPERLDPDGFEAEAERAGFAIEDIDVVGSNWREAWEEAGEARTSRQLLQAARLIRARPELLDTLGPSLYKLELANALWGVYQMIGKLEPRTYVLRAR